MLLALLLTVSPPPAPDPRPFAPLDLLELEMVAHPHLAPDGARVVYERRRVDGRRDRTAATLWIADVDGGTHRPLTGPDADVRGARWSPDGTRLAYLEETEQGRRIVVRWLDTGAEHEVASPTEPAEELAWSPDGTSIAFLARVPDEPEPWIEMPESPEGAAWADPPVVIDAFRYREDGEGYVEPGSRHLFVVPAHGGTPRRLTHGDFDHDGPPAWAPDGRSIVVSSNRRDDREMEPTDTDLYRVPLDGGEAERLTTRYGPDERPAVSPDGEWLAWLGADERRMSYQPSRIHLMPLGGGGPRRLAADLDRSIGRVAWTDEGLVFGYDEHGERRLGLVTLDGRRRDLGVRLQGASLGRPYTGGDFSVSRGGVVAFQRLASDRPAELGVLRPGGEAETLTDLHADLAARIDFARAEELWVESSFDGRRIQAWVLRPPRFDARDAHPLILEIHGGPHAAYGPAFSPELQLMAAAGYVVVYANPRGSTSYGVAFSNLIHHDYPSQDYDDLMSVVDAVVARGSIDEERLFVTGGSGGGVLTAWIVGKTDRFAAAVVAKPVVNWASFSLTADAYAYFTQWWFPAMPWEDPEAYWARSPLSLVGSVSTPTMLLTGEADYRTPISETEQYYQALKLRGVETAMVRIPGASHGIASRPSRLLYKVASILAWFEEHG